MTSPLMQALRDLDPDREHRSVAPTADDPALLAFMSPPDIVRQARPATLRQPRTWKLAGATAGIAVTLTVVGIVSPWGGTPAFASWTATPTVLSVAEEAARIAQCPRQFPTPDGTGRMLDPVLTDVRGAYTFAVFSDGVQVVQCYVETSTTGSVRAATGEAGPVRQDVGGSPLTAQSNGVTIWRYGPDGGGAVALAFGRAADDVAAVEATLADGRVVTATVENGWWALWVPGDTGLPSVATVTHTDGSVDEASITVGA